jgi:aminopeptidase-like protein
MKNFLKELGRLPRHINSPAYDYALQTLSDHYNLETIIYNSTSNHNGWEVPPKYSVINAYMKKNDKVIYDGTDHPLKVISYSSSFCGIVSKEELIKHCYFDHRDDTWIPYHFRQSYRPWKRDWGFCVPKQFIDTLEDGNYEVLIDIDEGREELKIGRGYIAGKSPIVLALCAHLDHPGLVNDDLSGVITILEVMKRLRSASLNYSLEVFIVPEIIGPQFYLNANTPPFEGLFVESVGQSSAFQLQASLNQKSIIDRVASRVVLEKDDAKVVPFRSIYGNDEINFETFGCPMPSLTRGNFYGYHSHLDCFENLSLNMIEDAINTVEKIVLNYQDEYIVEKRFEGLLSLANPKYGLYIDPGQAAFGTISEDVNLRRIMDVMSTVSKYTSLMDILRIANVDDEVSAINYLRKWHEKGLIILHGKY